jgi:hypothetical protein
VCKQALLDPLGVLTSPFGFVPQVHTVRTRSKLEPSGMVDERAPGGAPPGRSLSVKRTGASELEGGSSGQPRHGPGPGPAIIIPALPILMGSYQRPGRAARIHAPGPRLGLGTRPAGLDDPGVGPGPH